MSNTTTKNILLSQPRVGQGEVTPTVALTHTVVNGDKTVEVKAEVPGVDPSTIEVSFENLTVHIRCEKGELAIPLNPAVDISKIKADIVWGMLTLVIPLPEPPASGKIKVNIHESAPVKGKTQPSPQVKHED
jgi:HSP20 family molecular chaperone IbpA